MSLLNPTTYLNALRVKAQRGTAAKKATRSAEFIGIENLRRRAKKAKGTSKRMECLGAQIANGHVPEDMNEYEKGYFFGKDK